METIKNNTPANNKMNIPYEEKARTMSELSYKIEQIFMEHGEYLRHSAERMRWLAGQPDPDTLSHDRKALQSARLYVTSLIYDSLKSGIGAHELQSYLAKLAFFEQQKMRTGVISEDDYNKYYELINGIKDVVPPARLAMSANEFNNISIKDQSRLTIEDYNIISENMDVMSVNDYLFNEFGYESYDISDIDISNIVNGIGVEYELKLSQKVFDEELMRIYDDLKKQAVALVHNYEPMVTVSGHDAAIIPYLMERETGKIFTVNEVRAQIADLARLRLVTVMGDPDCSYPDCTPEYSDYPVKLDVTFDYNAIRDSVFKKLEEYKQEREKYSGILADMVTEKGLYLTEDIESRELCLRYEDSIYYVTDHTSGHRLFHDTEELIRYLNGEFTAVADSLTEAAKDIVKTSEYADSLPETYSDWKFFVSDYNMNDKNVRKFALDHRHELDIMKLAADPQLADLRQTYSIQTNRREAEKAQHKPAKANQDTEYSM